MNANAFRHFYNYHFAENRKVWGHVAALSFEQFTQPIAYAQGALREQVIHLLDVEDVWFSALRGAQPAEPIPASAVDDRDLIRAHWDKVEENIRAYLAALQDETLFSKPITEPEEDKDLFVWQVLLQVANHATDHRAQILRALHDMGVKTEAQDYIFYAYENPPR
ncbi:MAG: hypothetical protein Fur002_24190 [Anaerolineales bacterium]